MRLTLLPLQAPPLLRLLWLPLLHRLLCLLRQLLPPASIWLVHRLLGRLAGLCLPLAPQQHVQLWLSASPSKGSGESTGPYSLMAAIGHCSSEGLGEEDCQAGGEHGCDSKLCSCQQLK